MRRAVRVAKASLPLAVLAFGGASGCGGCSSKRHDRAFERELAAQLSKQLGPLGAGAEVRCSGELDAPDRCVAKVAGQALPIALRPEGEALHWELEGLVVSGRELEQQLTAELTDLGLSAKPSCGAPLQAVIAGERVSCSLSELGIAWATVRADGSYSWELALGAAQAERTHQVEEAELDELSRALDRAAGTGADEDDEGEGDEGKGEDGKGDGDEGKGEQAGSAAAAAAAAASPGSAR